MIPARGVPEQRSKARRLALLCAFLCVASRTSYARAGVPPEAASQAAADPDFPKRLAITIVASESQIATFGERVSSWFTDDTQVSVTVTSEVDLEQILGADPSEVRAWVVPLSPERALVTFSSVTQRSPARHLVREVPLRQGLDELGQERLASVIHSAFVALREGEDGVERAQAERALGAAGLSRESRSAPGEFQDPKAHTAAAVPPAPRVAAKFATDRPAPRARLSQVPAWLLLGVGYAFRARGSEGVGQGPSLALGVQLPSAFAPIDLLVSGQYTFRSSFDRDQFDASVQTSAFRAYVGIEPVLSSRWSTQVLLGAGADIARIHADTSNASNATLHTNVHANGTQWRGATELSAGTLWRSTAFELGVYGLLTVFVEDVHYSVSTDQGEQRLVTPQRLQPGLLVQGRFRSAL